MNTQKMKKKKLPENGRIFFEGDYTVSVKFKQTFPLTSVYRERKTKKRENKNR